MSNSTLRPVIVSVMVGLLIGLGIGLIYAWRINPATYSGGAYPHELSDNYQKAYVKTVIEAFNATGRLEDAGLRLEAFDTVSKVTLLADAESDLRLQDPTQAEIAVRLAQGLKEAEDWTGQDIESGLAQGLASPNFSQSLKSGSGQTPALAPTQGPDEAASEPSMVGRIFRWVIIIVVFVIGLLAILYLMTLIKPKRKMVKQEIKDADLVLDDGTSLKPLRQWVGAYAFGHDSYDESFTLETEDGAFLGECGMGILDGFASGTPKRVAAFDVWLFDKTDIRTVSTPIMSTFAFEDDVLRGKLNADAEPILATSQLTFDIETTALLVMAKIEQVEYGEEPPAESYFNNVKVVLTAYLKPDVDVSGDMPIPESMRSTAA